MKQAPIPAPRSSSAAIDVRGALRAASRQFTLAQLAREGQRSVSLLSKVRLAELIHRALRDLIEQYRAAERQRKQAPEIPEDKSPYERLQELIQQVDGVNQARAELESSRQSLLTELDDLRQELARQTALAAEEHEDALDRSPFLAVADFDRHIGAIVTSVCRNQLPAPDAVKPPGFQKEWDRLELLIRQRVLAVVREERGRVRVPPKQGKDLWRMEKRIEKLYTELDALEQALHLISTSKVSNPAIQNALRQLGLLNEDKNHEKKREMLKVVLDTNREIRRNHRELEARGISLSRPRE